MVSARGAAIAMAKRVLPAPPGPVSVTSAPASSDATQASQVTKPLRELAALVLLGANAVLLFVSLLRLLLPLDGYGTFTDRAGSTYYGFVGIEYEGSKLPEPAGIQATKKLLEKVRAELA